MTDHVLILGCGRSGTSIFGELFEHLSGYTYYSEPDFAAVLETDFGQPVAIKVPREAPTFPPTAGLSFPLDTMLEAIPQPRRIYWQVRHPLDAIASLRVGISMNWGHHPRPPDWREWTARPLLDQCAHHWNYINSVGYAQVRGIAQITRFEDMILDPQTFAATVGEQIGLEPRKHESELSAWSRRVQNTNNRFFVEAKTSRAYSRSDHTRRIGRWMENLTQAEAARCAEMVREAAGNLGYDLRELR